MSFEGMSDLLENKDNEEEFLKQVGVMISSLVILQKKKKMKRKRKKRKIDRKKRFKGRCCRSQVPTPHVAFEREKTLVFAMFLFH